MLFQDEQDPTRRNKYRTECWLERCVFEGKVCGADEHPSFSPLGIEIPIQGANNVILSLSGLDQSEVCWTRRLGRALGVTMAANFSRRTTHLLCPSGEGAKFDKAGEWRIPVVGYEWVAEIARTGVIPPAGHFLLGPGGVRLPAPEPEPQLELSMEVDARYDGKGKRKQTETVETAEAGMSDITNGNFNASFLLAATTDSRNVGSRSRAVSHELTGKPSLSRLVLPEEQEQHGHEDWSFGTPNGLLSETSASPRFSIRQPPDLLNERSSPPPPSSSRAGSVATVDDGRSATRSPSPDKLEAQRALQESLANLLVLGKRTTDSDFDSSELRRPGKRTRPLGKSKV
jgi:DNA replication regulator DPB11